MSKAIQVKDISKAYQLGNFSTGTISRDIERFIAKLRGKEDPFLKIGETNDRTKTGKSDIVWSLKDINFEIEQGDTVGVIGHNGAGKSTLLKILSRVTSPTTGTIKVKGKIASLLEVGTGFHPELTGKENIYLNGAILGMRKQEIKRKFDEIVDFAGVERYIDTPVKRFSSGMYVRLAFAVAAHLEAEILIVDEVLAVGDAEFQKKCLGKMGDISKGEGRTILFVSHNMGSIAKLCSNGILLENGKLKFAGSSTETIEQYRLSRELTSNTYEFGNAPKSIMYFTSVCITDSLGQGLSDFDFMEDIYVQTKFKIDQFVNSQISLTIQGKNEEYLTTIVEDLAQITNSKSGEFCITFKLSGSIIAPNSYYIRVALFILNGEVFDLIEMICPFKVHDSGSNLAALEGFDYGNYVIPYQIIKN